MFDALENLLNLVKTDIEMTHCEVTAKGKKAILAAQKAIEKAKGGRE
jgi:hypothetical protein